MLQGELTKFVNEDVKKKVDAYHADMKRDLEAYGTDLNDTLADHMLNAEEREALRRKVIRLRERVHQLIGDIQEAIEVHLGKKKVAA